MSMESPSERPRLRLGSLLSGALGALLCFGIPQALPAFRHLYEETGLPLPGSATFLLAVPVWAWWCGGLVSIPLLVLKDRWLEESDSGPLNTLFVALTVCAGVWVMYSLFSPLVIMGPEPL